MSRERKVAVIAGTPVDTRMGADFLRQKDASLQVIAYPVSTDPIAQTTFQFSDYERKHARLTQIFEELEQQGVRDFFIYCNSLSGSFDFEAFAQQRCVRIITPVLVYKTLAKRYKSLAFHAANLLGGAGLEKVMREANPDLHLIGVCQLALVQDIEAGLPPREIVERQALKTLGDFFEQAGAQVWILACTHFPYVKDVLSSCCSLPIIDPADEMYELLCANLEQ